MILESPRIPYLPERIARLAAIATDVSWSWNRNARRLFGMVDEPLWHLTRHNPIAMLRRCDPSRLSDCARDPRFLDLYDRVVREHEQLSSMDGTWFAQRYPESVQAPIAYFCAEFGLHNSVPIYSGGLGVLAGDHCKAASDTGVPLVGMGLFYTKGYFDQKLRLDGWQEDSDEEFDPANAPLERVLSDARDPSLAVLRMMGRDVHIGAWRMKVGRVSIYLLDTELDRNHDDDRELTHKLYAGGPEMRVRQEWVLGVGGVRVLRALGIAPQAWHANEGHAAFLVIERVRELMGAGHSFADALARVRACTIFTTHTPVPAGHDSFSSDQLEACAGKFWEEMGVSRETVMGLGQHPEEAEPRFHMTVLALRGARYVNGVAKQHGVVSREIWSPLWPKRAMADVPIGHVTNGVHLGTWMSKEVMDLLDESLGHDWQLHRDEPGQWEQVLKIDPARLWSVHQGLKASLFTFVREEARRRWTRHWSEAAHIVGAGTLLNPGALTIGFARRFATYKRANLLFSDMERLRALLVDNTRPVQIIFAGKAHPADTPGKEILQQVYTFTRDARLEGRVAFLEDYELHLAHRLVEGVDLWLNLPRVPLEASGTSGMKAALNGVPQLSTLDGWWHEGYDGLNGWAIPPASSRATPDDWDAQRLYALLEEQVVPLYYSRDEQGVPRGWVEKMLHAIRVSGRHFTTRRMLQDYANQYYIPAMRAPLDGDDPPTA